MNQFLQPTKTSQEMRGNPIPKDPGSVRGQFFHLSIGAILPVFLDDTVEPMAQGTKSRHTKPTG